MLGFEYQGQQHYKDIFALGNLWTQRERDKEKRKACEIQGITLIEVPYWWDFQIPSLVATIHNFASHLLPSKGHGDPISNQPPGESQNSKLKDKIYFIDNGRYDRVDAI